MNIFFSQFMFFYSVLAPCGCYCSFLQNLYLHFFRKLTDYFFFNTFFLCQASRVLMFFERVRLSINVRVHGGRLQKVLFFVNCQTPAPLEIGKSRFSVSPVFFITSCTISFFFFVFFLLFFLVFFTGGRACFDDFFIKLNLMCAKYTNF